MLEEKGWRKTGNDKVRSVILEGKGRLYSRVKPYVFAKSAEVDVDYYITNQMLPAASSILVILDERKAERLKETKEREEITSLINFV
jgi:DNA polymerase elongation subunit (family B)